MDPREKAEPYTMKICPVIFAQNSHGMAKDYFMVLAPFQTLAIGIFIKIIVPQNGENF